MESLHKLINDKNYINEFKKHKVIYRKYPDLQLMIVKRHYNTQYDDSIPWLNYCRGLVIDYINHKIIFIPPSKSNEIQSFDEFLNLFSNLDTFSELIDGTMINLFYHKKWLLSTRSNIGCTNKWSSIMSFKEMFDQCSSLNYDSLNKDNTYSFVMRHKKNRIITPIINNELYLIEVYNKLNKLDLSQNHIDNCFINNSIHKDFLSKDLIKHFYKGFTTYKNGIRYNWINPEYKFIEMIKPTTNNSCLNYLLLRKSGYLSTYIKMYPEERFKFNKYRKKLHNFTENLYEYYKNVFITKEIQKKDIPFYLRPLIYDIHNIYLKTKQGISWKQVKGYIYDCDPKKIYFAFKEF